MKKFQLNYRITMVIGLAFFSITMLWQVYNSYCSLMLNNLLAPKFSDDNQVLYIVGAIMAADNIFAIFMLPLFGKLSDRTHTKFGKRMPYIIIGMVLAAIAFPFIPIFYNAGSLVGVIIMMLVILIIMQSYRTPAVSLMPDITPKPLRSRANGIINVVGYLGAVIGGVLLMYKGFDVGDNIADTHGQPLYAFLIVSAMLVFAVILLLFKVHENKLVHETRAEVAEGEKFSTAVEHPEEDEPMSKKNKRNLFVLLGATFFWFAGFNAVETFLTIYTTKIYGTSNIGGTVVIILTVTSILTFIPAGIISEKIGRKKSILIGIGAIIIGFLIGSLNLGANSDPALSNPLSLYLCSAFAGIGWATINANSYPMVLEMAHQNNIGKVTGKYYLFSMLAQSVTPVVIGLFMYNGGVGILFLYSLICMVIALVIFSFTKEKKVARKKVDSLLDYLDIED